MTSCCFYCYHISSIYFQRVYHGAALKIIYSKTFDELIVLKDYWLTNDLHKVEANDNKKEIKKQEKKELKDNNNTQSNKQKETEIEEKGQLPVTRNENRKRKDINENIENTKNQDK